MLAHERAQSVKRALESAGCENVFDTSFGTQNALVKLSVSLVVPEKLPPALAQDQFQAASIAAGSRATLSPRVGHSCHRPGPQQHSLAKLPPVSPHHGWLGGAAGATAATGDASSGSPQMLSAAVSRTTSSLEPDPAGGCDDNRSHVGGRLRIGRCPTTASVPNLHAGRHPTASRLFWTGFGRERSPSPMAGFRRGHSPTTSGSGLLWTGMSRDRSSSPRRLVFGRGRSLHGGYIGGNRYAAQPGTLPQPGFGRGGPPSAGSGLALSRSSPGLFPSTGLPGEPPSTTSTAPLARSLNFPALTPPRPPSRARVADLMA